MTKKELEKIELLAIVYNDCLRRADAVVCLEGDGEARIGATLKIFKAGLAKVIVVSGGLNQPPFSLGAVKMGKKFMAEGVAKDKLIIEEKSQNTYEQAKEVMKIAKQKKWRKIILVASNFHQPRAYLTFLKARQDAKLKIQLFNAPVRELAWFRKTALAVNRLELLKNEFKKIDDYLLKGHLVSFKKAIKYQAWKERQK